LRIRYKFFFLNFIKNTLQSQIENVIFYYDYLNVGASAAINVRVCRFSGQLRVSGVTGTMIRTAVVALLGLHACSAFLFGRDRKFSLAAPASSAEIVSFRLQRLPLRQRS